MKNSRDKVSEARSKADGQGTQEGEKGVRITDGSCEVRRGPTKTYVWSQQL